MSKNTIEEKALPIVADDKDIKAVDEKTEKECLSVSVKDVDGTFTCSVIAEKKDMKILAKSTGSKSFYAAETMITKGVYAVTGDCNDLESLKQKSDDYLALIAELNPKTAYEGLLISQMAIVHQKALECFRWADANTNQSKVYERIQNQGIKLMKLFNQQIATLDKHRLKGNQKMVVEHVHVHDGGQAIVGEVHQGGKDEK